LPDVLPRFTSPTVDGYPVTVRPLVVIEPRANDDYIQYTVHFRLQPVRNQRDNSPTRGLLVDASLACDVPFSGGVKFGEPCKSCTGGYLVTSAPDGKLHP